MFGLCGLCGIRGQKERKKENSPQLEPMKLDYKVFRLLQQIWKTGGCVFLWILLPIITGQPEVKKKSETTTGKIFLNLKAHKMGGGA
jgi:hypothetical protein